jgi:hypothetical protein
VSELVLERVRPLERGWILGWYAASRALVFVTASLVDAFGPRGYTGNDERLHPFGVLASWDGRWYRTVAENGYLLEPGRQSDPAFFPLFPMLLRAGHALGMSYPVAGIVIANVAFLVALFLFEALTRALFGSEMARRATVLLAVFPLSFVFSLAYPESVVLALIAGAALAAYRGRWGITAAALAAGALARPETVFVALPLLPLARRARTGAAYGALLAPVAAVGAFALYLGHTLGDPLAWTQAERAWGRKFELLGFVRAVELIPQQFHGNGGVARDVACFLVYAVLLAIGWRRGVPRLWVLAALVVVVLPTFSGSFHSIGRFGLLAPAVVWGAAQAIRSRPALAYGVSAGLMVAGVATLPYFFP